MDVLFLFGIFCGRRV